MKLTFYVVACAFNINSLIKDLVFKCKTKSSRLRTKKKNFTQKMAMQRENVMGIDLGTQNCCVGIFLADSGQIDIVPNSFGSQITPSWVGFEEDGRIIVGKSAQNCTC